MWGLLWTIAIILIVLWLLGVIVLHVSSFLIHLLLIVAIIAIVYNLFAGRRTRTRA